MNIAQIALMLSESKNERSFYDYVDRISKESIESQKQICNQVFKIFDTEAEKENLNQSYLRIVLAIPVELSILHEEGKSYFTPLQKQNLIDFIASQFLARSNNSHDSLRTAMMIFFERVKSQSTWKKQRVLERFGENILTCVFDIHIKDKNKSSIAFSFLSEHLESFLTTSPHLAEMTNAFLQNQMLKQPAVFVEFLMQYNHFLIQNNKFKKFFIVHLAFLIRQSFELDHEILILNISKILFEYIYSNPEKNYAESLAIFSKVLIPSKSLKAREAGIYLQNESKGTRTITVKALFKHLSFEIISDKSQNIKLSAKKLSFESATPFQQILALFIG